MHATYLEYYIIIVVVAYIYIYIILVNLDYIWVIHIEQKIWGCRLVKSHFSQLVSAYDRFQGNFFIMGNVHICEKLHEVRFMLYLIFPYKVFLSSLQ